MQLGLAENGGDPTQDGCFFEVDDVEKAFVELRANGFDRETPIMVTRNTEKPSGKSSSWQRQMVFVTATANGKTDAMD